VKPLKRFPDQVTLATEYRGWMLDEKGWAKLTRQDRSTYMEHADRFTRSKFGMRLCRADKTHVLAYISEAKQPSTRNHRLQALKAWFRFLVEHGYRRDDPTLGIEHVKEAHRLPRPISADAAGRLLIGAKLVSKQTEAIVGVLLYSGCRRSEIAALRWGDIDFHERRFRVMGKGAKERILPMSPALADVLTLWRMRSADAGWVFPSPLRSDRHISPQSVWREVVSAGQAVSLKVTTHQTRHTFATELLANRVDIRHVQELLGHVSLSSTQTYTGVSIGHLEEDVASLDFSKPQ
jgi:integrase/recombinase XerD